MSLYATLPNSFATSKSQQKSQTDDDEILTGFGVRFMYTNTVPALEQREIQKVDITIPVYVVLGKMVSA